jgi:tetratricopeptide (TPR) repeat protein
MPSLPSGEKKLILTPPPVVPPVEPLQLEKESGLPAEPPTYMREKRASSPPSPESRELARSTGERREVKPISKAKAREAPRKDESSKVSVAPELSEEVRYHFNLALFYHEEKNFPQARRGYEKVVQMWPLYAEAHNNLGVVYKELGMYDEALAQIKKAIALNPRYTRAYHNLGVIFQVKGDFKQATKNYLVAISQDPKHLGSYNNLGLVYRVEKRLHEARDLLEKALTMDSSYPQTHYNLALVLEEMGEKEQARFHYQKFLDLSGERDSRLAERVRDHIGGLRPTK